ncbi:hypothetical protein ACJ41O_006516 [Fusarium nematophilum]
MDIPEHITQNSHGPISCVEMHTVGMPTRIITKGYPTLTGTLLDQRMEAERKYDHIRKRIILEPRGHSDMFGAILRPWTELTESGQAHMGLLYLHQGGYSNMCGHATVAVSRFLVDTQDLDIFPQRRLVKYDPTTQTSRVILHTLKGLVEAAVPTSPDGTRSDPTRPVAFIALPAFAMATDLEVTIPTEHQWPQLDKRTSVRASIAYCSAFSCQIDLSELGFSTETLRGNPPLGDLKYAVAQLKKAMNIPKYQKYLTIPQSEATGSIFGVMVVDKSLGAQSQRSKGAETGLYIFADGAIDRSPTGSVAAARAAIAFSKGELGHGDSWTYHSVLSNTFDQSQGFLATVLQGEGRRDLGQDGYAAGPVIIEVQGFAYYTGSHTFVVEQGDPLGIGGFAIDQLQ